MLSVHRINVWHTHTHTHAHAVIVLYPFLCEGLPSVAVGCTRDDASPRRCRKPATAVEGVNIAALRSSGRAEYCLFIVCVYRSTFPAPHQAAMGLGTHSPMPAETIIDAVNRLREGKSKEVCVCVCVCVCVRACVCIY